MSVGSNEKKHLFRKNLEGTSDSHKKTFRDEFALQPIKPAFRDEFANLDTHKLYLDIPPIKPFPDEF